MLACHMHWVSHNAPIRVFSEYSSAMTAGHFSREIEAKRSQFLFILLGALAQIHVNFVGEIFLAELLLYSIWVLRKKQLKFNASLFVKNSQLVIFQKLLIGAFAVQLITDLIRGTSFLDMAKGSSLILFTLFNLIVISKLTTHYSGVVQNILIGYGLSYFVGAIIQPNAYFQSYPWKFGFAYGTTLLLFILLQNYFVRNHFATAFIILIFAVINLALDTRSLALVIFIAGGIYFLNQFLKNSKVIAIAILIVSFIVAPSLYTLYVSEASKGTFGLIVQQKYLNQSYNTQNIFYGGRTDVFVGLSQIKKNPIAGQGSYAKISSSNRQEILTEITRINPNLYPLLFTYQEGKLIPIHSVLFQFWVWYGIIGALPWLWYLYMVTWTLKRNMNSGTGISLVNSYLLTLVVWDILFSPFGGDRRFTVPLILIALIQGSSDTKIKLVS